MDPVSCYPFKTQRSVRSLLLAQRMLVHATPTIHNTIIGETKTTMPLHSRELLRATLRFSVYLRAYSGQGQGMVSNNGAMCRSYVAQGGHFSISPTVTFSTKQNYLPNSNVSRPYTGCRKHGLHEESDFTNQVCRRRALCPHDTKLTPCIGL